MEFAFPWPTTDGEWLAFGSASFTVFLGLLFLFAPGIMLRVMRLQTADNRPDAAAEIRGRMAGFYLGLGVCTILLAQPWLYMALGFSWLFTAFGRFVSMLSDRGNTVYNWIMFVIELGLAALPLGFTFGLLP